MKTFTEAKTISQARLDEAEAVADAYAVQTARRAAALAEGWTLDKSLALQDARRQLAAARHRVKTLRRENRP